MKEYNEQVFEDLVETASYYDKHAIRLYLAEIGWQDWMSSVIEHPEHEMLSDDDLASINEILISAFEKAHNRSFCPECRRQLLYL